MNISDEPLIIDIVRNDLFIKRVRRQALTLLNSNHYKDEDIIDIALHETYPRISLILSSSKTDTKDGPVPIFGGIGPRIDYELQYRQILSLLKDSPYSEGIHRVAIVLTASSLIKSIPLNADIKLLELGKDIETGALADLDRLIGLISNTDNAKNKPEPGVSDTLYLASSINLSTIPPTIFDRSTGINSARGVEVYDSIYIPEGRIGVAWVYLTGTSIQGYSELGIWIQDGMDVEELGDSIARSINDLSAFHQANIICSFNRGISKTEPLSKYKRDLYPGITEGRDSIINFSITARVHSLRLASRRLSTAIRRDMVIVKLYTLPDTVKDITEAINLRHSDLSEDIGSILYGITPEYSTLATKGPHSLIIDTDKQSVSADPALDSSIRLDTLYFSASGPIQGGVLEIRTTNPSMTPIGWFLQIPDGATPEYITTLLLTSIQERQLDTLLIGAMTRADAITLTSSIRSYEEVRVGFDIIQHPANLLIALGNSFRPFTNATEGPRSLILIPQQDQRSDMTDLASPAAAVVAKYRHSGRLQRAYDRIDLMRYNPSWH
jgi:hypothetical protein